MVVVMAALTLLGAALVAVPAVVTTASAQGSTSIVLNEWNAVGGSEMLAEGDVRLGQITANGGDWFELVVVADVDARGWSLALADEMNTDTLTLSEDTLWSDLRAGTIITVSEEPITAEDGTVFAEDTSYDPANGDWWIHVVAGEFGTGTFIEAQNFFVNSDGWTLTVIRADETVDYGPAGEGVGLLPGGVNDSEVGELEADPSPDLTAATAPYDDGDSSTFGLPNEFGGVLQDLDALRVQAPTCNGFVVTVDLGAGQLPTDGDDVILGTAGDDTITAGAGNDTICAGAGNDSIWGQDGNDTVFGRDGDDRIRGGAGDDILDGGEGADDINGGRDNDIVLGGAGNDTALRGGTGDDTVDGGEGDDALIAGNGGRDTVLGGPGDDKITGGPRPDILMGGDGNDLLRGLGGADQLNGDAGDDQLFGSKQGDTLDGGLGNDTCNGGTTGDGALEFDTAVSCEIESNLP